MNEFNWPIKNYFQFVSESKTQLYVACTRYTWLKKAKNIKEDRVIPGKWKQWDSRGSDLKWKYYKEGYVLTLWPQFTIIRISYK